MKAKRLFIYGNFNAILYVASMNRFPSFSIVINTLNRGDMLRQVLESFRWLKYQGDFEVVVVNGPSTDNSDEVIQDWAPYVRVGKCDVANLSVSRNIGICMARGDIVAFIDDDAIPEPEWLRDLARAYTDPMVGGAGGLVYDHTGYCFQYRYCLVDRFGNADLTPPGPTPHLSFPKSNRIPHLLGANSSFRRSALLEIGGFDEEYEYYLDETDVCLRIVDAGYLIAQIAGAYVHHKFAPSNLRDTNRVARYRYPIIKNKIYFTLKNSREFHSLDRVLEEQQVFIQSQKNDVRWCVEATLLSQADQNIFDADLERALETGLRRGFEGVLVGSYINEEKLTQYAGEFLPFHPIDQDDSRCIVLVSRDFPPCHGGGIATFNKDLAEALGAEGHFVHVITQSPDINRVDFEQGVWVHRMVPEHLDMTAEAVALQVPQHVWNWSATALREASRIASHRKIDVVEAPVWDCEGIAFLLDSRWPLVTSLQTTLHFWLDSHPDQRNDARWMDEFGKPMLALEARVMTGAHAVRSISEAIRREIERAYGFALDDERVLVLPLGMAAAGKSESTPDIGQTEVLFVGRLEGRKGIDVLLAAVPKVLAQASEVQFRVIGDDTLPGAGGMTYKDVFLASDAGRKAGARVQFEGRVDEEVLRAAYARCSVFVAPSRFESFGLVFLEAMREGKPVIGCRAGGMPEIIDHDVNGLLVEPGDVDALASAILELVCSPQRCREMGENGRRKFMSTFTAERMAKESATLYDRAAAVHARDELE